jgi:beta-lactam-binding protein with PASTA domain
VSIDTGYGLPRVPDVIGVPRVDAGRTVQAAGLTVSYNASPEPSCDHLGQVVAQVPDPGTIVDPGSRVLLTLATKPAKACL